MTRQAGRRLAVATALLVWAGTGPVQAQTGSASAYEVQDLGTLGGSASWALGTLQFGNQVVGVSTTESGAEHAFTGDFSGLRDLGTLGGVRSEARDTQGTWVVGSAQLADGRYHAFVTPRTPPAALVDLGTLGGAQSFAFAIDDAFPYVVVGVADTAQAGVYRPFTYTPGSGGSLSELPVSLGGPSAAATAISHGWIAGYADLPGGAGHHAFLYSTADGVTRDLGSFGGHSEARGVNPSGVVVGAAWLDADTRHAFRYADGVLQDLGTLGGGSSEALAIAADGAIVGWAEDGLGRRRAFLWRNGVMSDLNALLPASDGWELEAATAVTERPLASPAGGSELNLIAGYGRRDGAVHAVLLGPPVPVRVSLTDHANGVDTNLPNPHETGETVRLAATVHIPFATPLAGFTLVDTISGPAEIVDWIGPPGAPATACLLETSQRLVCRLAPSSFLGTDVTVFMRSTGPGTITHAAHGVSQTNTAISLATLTADTTTVVGGQPLLMRTTLTSPVGEAGARVLLASSDPAIASVPERFDVLPWCCEGIYREFYVTTQPVSAPTVVTISATFGLVTQAVSLTLLPEGGGEPSTAVTWTSPVNVTVGPGTIEKTSGCDGCFDASAVSAETLGPDGGALTFTVVDPARLHVVGLSDANGPPTDVDFGILSGGAWADVREHGAYRTSVPVAAGDVFRLAVDASGMVTYARNGQVFHTSSTVAILPLRAVAVLAAAGARLEQVTISGGTVTPPPTGGAAPVTWTALANATVTGDRVTKTSGCDGCFDASAVSAERLGAGGGVVTFTVVDPARLLVAGLSDANGHPTDVDFGIAHGGPWADVRENGAYRASVPVAPGDVFRIAVDGSGAVTYARNGTVFYTSGAVAVAPLRAVVVLAAAGASVEQAALSGATATPPPPTDGTAVAWATLVNATATGDGVAKSSGCDGCFDATAVSSNAIAAAGGALTFTVVDPARLLVAGLSDASGAPEAVDFGLRHGGASAEVRENGAYRAEVAVSAGDVFRVAVSASGVVTYARNGQVFYTSGVPAAAPLRAVVVMAAAGARVDQVRMTGTEGAAATTTSAP